MVASQLAPPIMTKVSGSRALTRRASASDARCCWNTLVNPTMRGCVSTTRSAHQSMKSLADALAEPKGEVLGAAGEAARGHLRLQQAEPERRRQQRPERHRDQENVDRRAHRVGVGAAGSAANSRAAAVVSGCRGPALDIA